MMRALSLVLVAGCAADPAATVPDASPTGDAADYRDELAASLAIWEAARDAAGNNYTFVIYMWDGPMRAYTPCSIEVRDGVVTFSELDLERTVDDVYDSCDRIVRDPTAQVELLLFDDGILRQCRDVTIHGELINRITGITFEPQP